MLSLLREMTLFQLNYTIISSRLQEKEKRIFKNFTTKRKRTGLFPSVPRKGRLTGENRSIFFEKVGQGVVSRMRSARVSMWYCAK